MTTVMNGWVRSLFCVWTISPSPTSAMSKSFGDVPHNVWTPFNSWGMSSPVGKLYAAATTVIDYRKDGSLRESMLMYGGMGYIQDAATWLYVPEMKMWQSLQHSPYPPVRAFHTVVTLCGRLVVLFGGADTATERKQTDDLGAPGCKNETWIFDMSRKQWSLLTATSRDGESIRPRCQHAAAVVSQPNSGCSCKESMLVYGGVSFYSKRFRKRPTQEFLSDLWELRCIQNSSENGLPVFKWILFDFNADTFVRLQLPQATSAFNNSEFILFGWKTDGDWSLLSFNLTHRKWVSIGLGKRQSAPGKILYMSSQTTESDNTLHLLIGCCSPLWVLDLVTGAWYRPKQLPDEVFPQLQAETVAIASVGGSILTFGGNIDFQEPESTLWNLTLINPNLFYCSVLEVESPPLRHTALNVGGLVDDDKLVLFGGSVYKPNHAARSVNDMWILDLTTLIWEKQLLQNAPPDSVALAGAILHESVLVIYGGLSLHLDQRHSVEDMAHFWEDTWGYDYYKRTWLKYQTDRNPGARALHSALSVNLSALVILGGLSPPRSSHSGVICEPKRDIWSFTLNRTSPISRATWAMQPGSGPQTHSAHAVALLRGKVVVYGGTHSYFNLTWEIVTKAMNNKFSYMGNLSWSLICEDTMWAYDLKYNVWEVVNYVRKAGPGPRCFPSAAQTGDNMLIHGGCIRADLRIHLTTNLWEYKCSLPVSKRGTWLYNRGTETWTQLNKSPPSFRTSYLSLTVEWTGTILELGGVAPGLNSEEKHRRTGFSVYKPECPPGTYTLNFISKGCLLCEVGFYSSSSGPNCTQCPYSLSTTSAGSTSKDNCSVCDPSGCGHGRCKVTLPGPELFCECDFGFTKNNEGHCSVATYYLAGSGFLVGILLLLLVVAVTVRHKRAAKTSRAALRNKDHELVELTSAWSIDPRELKLGSRIDRSSPGGFGDVYEADYREMTVAVKKLKEEIFDFEPSRMEFEREIQVMRTIRHPNVVMFLGAGRFDDFGCPFIVMEYMSRGALTSVLRNRSITLTKSQQIRFAIEAAKGMRFLHSRRPPRIHRDLKSGNLLVSERWVVKVADFGSARLVKDEGVEQHAVRGTGPLSIDAPLLQPQYALSTCVGTVFWTAPELLQAENYGTAVDVYSFGIVLWEIWSRELPYDDFHFSSQLHLRSAVLDGVRPTLSSSWPRQYITLLKDCWSGAAACRPTFGAIVERLENFNETRLLQTN